MELGEIKSKAHYPQGLPHEEAKEELAGGPTVTHHQLMDVTNTIIKSFMEEIGYLQKRMFRLESSLDRFNRLFETAFQEELKRRVGDKDPRGYADQVQELTADPTHAINRALSGILGKP